MNNAKEIIDFYRSGGRTRQGYTLDDILSWNDEELEADHGFVQWLFPTFQASAFNPDAPVLTEEVAAAFCTDESLKHQLLRSLDRMLTFYGLERTAAGIRRGPNWETRRETWLVYGDHNHLRITRILDSLATLGLGDVARAMLSCLEDIAATDEGRREFDPRSLEFWRRAAGSDSKDCAND